MRQVYRPYFKIDAHIKALKHLLNFGVLGRCVIECANPKLDETLSTLITDALGGWRSPVRETAHLCVGLLQGISNVDLQCAEVVASGVG